LCPGERELAAVRGAAGSFGGADAAGADGAATPAVLGITFTPMASHGAVK